VVEGLTGDESHIPHKGQAKNKIVGREVIEDELSRRGMALGRRSGGKRRAGSNIQEAQRLRGLQNNWDPLIREELCY